MFQSLRWSSDYSSDLRAQAVPSKSSSHELGLHQFQNASARLPKCPDTIASYGTLFGVKQAIWCTRAIFINITISASPVSIDQVISDFDGVTFHISTPEKKHKILISISVRCYNELLQYGAQQVLEREYGPYIVSAEVGYDFSILIDLETLPEDAGRASCASYVVIPADGAVHLASRDDLIRRISLLKRNAMAAPFERAFDDFAHRQEEASKFTRESAPEGLREGGEVMSIHYRDEEAIYIKASHDRVTVIFSTIFREETDRIFGKVFLQVSSYGMVSRVNDTHAI